MEIRIQDALINRMNKIISEYGFVTLNDLKGLLGEPKSIDGDCNGWVNLDIMTFCIDDRNTLLLPGTIDLQTVISPNQLHKKVNLEPIEKNTHRAEILDEAKKCVCGKREEDYCSPEDNFKFIADLWSTYLSCHVTASDAVMMMDLLKIARIKTGSATLDSFVNLAGYAACVGEIATNNKKESK